MNLGHFLADTRGSLLSGCQYYLNVVATFAAISKHSVSFAFRLRAGVTVLAFWSPAALFSNVQ